MNTTTEPTPALEIPLEGRALIEASAGTGKTWTLTGIILRLLIEGGYPPREIIATTFTRKAAAEMQQRVHKRLHALRENLKAIAARYLAEETVLNDDDGLAIRLDDIIGGSGGDLINRHLILNAVALSTASASAGWRNLRWKRATTNACKSTKTARRWKKPFTTPCAASCTKTTSTTRKPSRKCWRTARITTATPTSPPRARRPATAMPQSTAAPPLPTTTATAIRRSCGSCAGLTRR